MRGRLRAVVMGVLGTLVGEAVVGVEMMAAGERAAWVSIAPDVFRTGWLSIASPLLEMRFAMSPTIGLGDCLGLWAMIRTCSGARFLAEVDHCCRGAQASAGPVASQSLQRTKLQVRLNKKII